MEQKEGIAMRIGNALTTRVGTVFLVLAASLIVVSILGYRFKWQWTGLVGTQENGPKTLWDWLELLIVPMVLAAGALWLRNIAQERASAIEELRAQEAALETYFDRMSDLLMDQDIPLHKADPGTACREMASTRTLTVLRRLDWKRRNHVLQFLRDARLLGEEHTTKETDGRETTEERHLTGILAGRNMSDMDLSWANLNGADLGDADLNGADLNTAHLSKAQLRKANLSGADLRDADLSGADLNGANLSFANLSAYLSKAHLNGADLSWANLSEAYLDKAHLGKANLSRADLFKANLTEANLSGAHLSKAHLRKANLSGANLAKANLIGAKGLTCKQLRQAHEWESAFRDEALSCGAEIPEPPKDGED